MLSLDAMDIGGEQHLDVKHDIIKRRSDSHGQVIESRQDGIGAPKVFVTEKPLQRHGGRLEHDKTYCRSCYGVETMRNAVIPARRSAKHIKRKCKREGFLQKIKEEEGEGCNIYGFLEVNKVAGNFHFARGKNFRQSNVHVHDLLAFRRIALIVQWMQEMPIGMYQYFIKVVPTVYTDVSGHPIQSNQFSVTEHFRNADLGKLQSMPGVFFFNYLSPIKLTFNEEHVSFSHFLTNMCAIVGGAFTVSGILDSFVYHGQKAIKNKMEIGKSS